MLYRVTYGLVKIPLQFLRRETEGKIKECLKMITFEMGNTLLTFIGKYYEYDNEWEIRDKGLTINGYVSAWLADLVAAFMLESLVWSLSETGARAEVPKQ
jgi:hypothetical protein